MVENLTDADLAQMTEDQILHRGAIAEEALRNPAIQAAFTEVQRQAIAVAFTSEPHERNMRESQYYVVQAVMAIVSTLKQWVIEAQSLQTTDSEDN